MKLIVSVLLSTILGVVSAQVRANEILQRRQFNGYSNSILHESPGYLDQTAQSTVKVNYNTNQIDSRQPIYTGQYLNQQTFPQDYLQTYQKSPPQSQLFNVGYSVMFTNNNNRQPKYPPVAKFPRSNLDDGEIITGTRKQNEEVQGPTVHMSPQEFVTTSLIANKKQKISGIKPKPHFSTTFPNPNALLTQANLSPTTQKYYKAIEQAKPQIQNVQDLQQRYSWRHLSPGVEIIRSTEVPTPSQKYTRPESVLNFDHAKALGRSQEFDYTNAIDNSNVPQLFYSHLKKPQLVKAPSPQQPLLVGGTNQKLPLDTSLLREPIQIDTKFIEEAVKNQVAAYGNDKYGQGLEQVQDNNNYLQQAYRTIPVHENTQSSPAQQVIYQPDHQPQGLLDYHQLDQNRFQYKIYGKPQPVVNVFGEQKTEHVQRQPRFLSNLNTNLRPPPLAVAYQRRVLLG